MMELTQEQLGKIGEQVSGDVPLEEVLLNKFPGARITIIRGHDNFSCVTYTEGAFFNEDQARKPMAEISLKRTLLDTYHLVTGTVEELNDGKIHDMETGQTLYNLYRSMVYSSLQERLTE